MEDRGGNITQAFEMKRKFLELSLRSVVVNGFMAYLSRKILLGIQNEGSVLNHYFQIIPQWSMLQQDL